MEKVDICPICKHDAFSKIATNSKLGITSSVVRCINCAFVFLEEQLDDEELFKFYRDSYRTNKRESFDESRHLGDLERSISQFEFFKDFLKIEDEIVDIGAGWGINANYLLSKGYEKIVVNESDDKVEQQLNKRIIRKTELIGSAKNKYNFIIMSHTLEHLFDLQGKMTVLSSMLKDGGRLFLEVPNAKNDMIVKGFSESYHYWYFMMTNLLSLAENTGFKVLKTGVFGKKRLMSDMNQIDFANWRKKVFEDNVSSIVELPEDHERAYWLRILLERSENID